MIKGLGCSVLVAGLLCLGSALPGAAHEGHKKKASPSAAPTSSPSPGTPAAAPASVEPEDTPAAAPTLPAAEPAPPSDQPLTLRTLPWGDVLQGHLHNKIVHFPLALGLAAGVILLVSPRWPAYEPSARVLLVAGALFAVAAYFSGQAQHEAFEDGMLEGIMRLHEKAGIATGILLVLGVVVTSLESARRWRWLYALVLLAVLTGTGMLGGLLSHGSVG
jgi:uncharacterized membrane protein